MFTGHTGQTTIHDLKEVRRVTAIVIILVCRSIDARNSRLYGGQTGQSS